MNIIHQQRRTTILIHATIWMNVKNTKLCEEAHHLRLYVERLAALQRPRSTERTSGCIAPGLDSLGNGC